MKRLNKRDNVSSILKRRATTIMMAATVIGAVGMSSTLVNAGEIKQLSANDLQEKVDRGETVSLKGLRISTDGTPLSRENKLSGIKNNINLASKNENSSFQHNDGTTQIKGERFESDGNSGYLDNGITKGQGEVHLNGTSGGVKIVNGEKLSENTLKNESKNDLPIENQDNSNSNEVIKAEFSPREPFKTMESHNEGTEVKKEVPLYSDTVVTKRVDNDRIAKVERTLTIGEKVTQYPNGREIIRKREEKTVKTFIERIFESAPIISGYLSKNLPSEGGSRNIPNPHGKLEKPLEGTEGFREFPESTIHRGGGIQEEVGNTRRIAGSPGGTLHDKILQGEGLGGFEQDIRSGGTLNSKIHGLFGFNEFPLKGKEGKTKYPIVGGSNITKLPGKNGEINRFEEGLSGKTRTPLKGEEGLSGRTEKPLKGKEGLSGRIEKPLKGEEGLSGRNNGLTGIEGGNSGNRETNNNSLKKNHSNGTWDLENIKPLIERDSDVYRPIYERKNHCRRICNPCRRTNPRIIYRPMNSGRRCLPRMSHTGPSFGINGFLGSIMLYLSAKVR